MKSTKKKKKYYWEHTRHVWCLSFGRQEGNFLFHTYPTHGSPGGAVVKNPPADAGDAGDAVSGLVQKILWGRKWQCSPVFLPGKLGKRSLAGYTTVHGDEKSWTQLSDWAHSHTRLKRECADSRRYCQAVFQCDYTNLHTKDTYESSSCYLYSLLLFHLSHSDESVVLFHYGFNLDFPDD